MSENTPDKTAPNSYPGLFAILAALVLLATLGLAVGGIYFSFINPSF